MKTAAPWRDPRTGIWYLRKRIPARLKAASGRSSEIIKISTGTADRAQALREWPKVLARYAALEADWERAANVAEVTPDQARELAARWAAWIAGDPSRLDTGGERSGLFADGLDGRLTDEAERLAGKNEPRAARREQRLNAHAQEAAKLVGLTVSEASGTALRDAMLPVVAAAYREAGFRSSGIRAAEGPRWNPLTAARASLPMAADVPAESATASLNGFFEGWRVTAPVKARTIADSRYALNLLIAHLGHDDASRITRADLAGWRDAIKADGKSNTTWNNRLSFVRGILQWGVDEGRIVSNPADEKLRLKKQRTAVRLPYTDAETVKILEAARLESRASLRWAPWVMAFSGMRVAEVLQLDVADVRHEGDVWFLEIHEDDPEKSVKTGQRRRVPLHKAVIDEGFLAYAQSVPADGPLFPDKQLDRHGQRGGRGWNVTGKWVREKVGIKDPAKAPNHSFRHRAEDEMRAAEVPEDVRDAILGHARKTTGRLYGVRGESLARLHRAVQQLPVPAGLMVGRPWG